LPQLLERLETETGVRARDINHIRSTNENKFNCDIDSISFDFEINPFDLDKLRMGWMDRVGWYIENNYQLVTWNEFIRRVSEACQKEE
jgi:hypothetical protein